MNRENIIQECGDVGLHCSRAEKHGAPSTLWMIVDEGGEGGEGGEEGSELVRILSERCCSDI